MLKMDKHKSNELTIAIKELDSQKKEMEKSITELKIARNLFIKMKNKKSGQQSC
jgi:hypothetical protein